MYHGYRRLNLVLGGGGVKGIAYIGAFYAMERRGFLPGAIAGVSAGALAGSLAAAGYDSAGMWEAMDRFDFKGIQMEKLHERVPAVKGFMEFARSFKGTQWQALEKYLAPWRKTVRSIGKGIEEGSPGRGVLDRGDLDRGLLGKLMAFCREGCLYDGDLLEEWVARTLRKKGVRTFGDLRGGFRDESNPRGYLLRMTGVDCSRVRIVTLPDDAQLYGIDPDDLEVAKAVRISTSVPFVFKPAELNGHSLVDGGVLDSFPGWLQDGSGRPTAAFRLNAGENKLFSLDTPLAVLKGLISSVHDIGGPVGGQKKVLQGFPTGAIDTARVSFLDFGITEEDKDYLYNAGKNAANELFDRMHFKSRAYAAPGWRFRWLG